MDEWRSIINKIGIAVIRTGVFISNKASENYRKIDPDVIRHLVQVPLLGYSFLVSRHEKINPGKPDGYPPLIFVHGLAGNRGQFLLMAGYLWLLGRKRSYKINFDSGQSVEDMAAALAHFIRGVRRATGEKQVEIIAHSLGGIVARLAISKYRLSSGVRTLITLGTPHHGTYHARYANTTIIRELRPDSKIIKFLDKQRWPKGVRGVTFWSRNDLFVLPAESAALNGTEKIDATPFTHYSYLIDPKSWAAVGRALDSRQRH